MPLPTIPLQSLRAFVHLLVERFRINRCPQVASSLAFTTLLSLVPLLTVAVSLFSHLPGLNMLGSALRTFLQNNLLPDRAGTIITKYALEFSQQATRLTLIGTVMIAVTALLLLFAIERILNQIWGVTRPRPMLHRITVYWFVLTLGPVILGGSIAATGYLVSSSSAWVPSLPWISDLVATLVPPMLLWILFSFLYYAVPNYPVRPVYALTGGLFAAGIFILMQHALGQFIAHVPTYTLVYGAFAVLPIFLVWLYLSWATILLGALLSATLPALFNPPPKILHFPGSRTWAITTILIRLAIAQHHGQQMSLSSLSHAINIPEAILQHLLEEVAPTGWVASTVDDCWVLAIDPEKITTRDIFEHFTLSTTSWAKTSGNHASALIGKNLAAGLTQHNLTLAQLRDQETGEPESPPFSPADTVHNPDQIG